MADGEGAEDVEATGREVAAERQEEKVSERRGWIGVDLDGTLAYYDEWRGADHVGPPIEPMLEKVKAWLQVGYDIRIFTARVSHDGTARQVQEAREATEAIGKWCYLHLGKVLPITCRKDYDMLVLWDDRTVCVEKNTGRVIGAPAEWADEPA